MELVDIVDKNDKVLYQTTKHKAHQQGLLHRCIIAQLIDPQGRRILVKQAQDRQDPGQYVSPVGGHIRAGESELAALKREAEEEIGASKFTHKYIGKAIYSRTACGRKENHFFILYEIFSAQKPKLNHESVSFRRFPEATLKKELKQNPQIFGAAFHFVAKIFYPKFHK